MTFLEILTDETSEQTSVGTEKLHLNIWVKNLSEGDSCAAQNDIDYA